MRGAMHYCVVHDQVHSGAGCLLCLRAERDRLNEAVTEAVCTLSQLGRHSSGCAYVERPLKDDCDCYLGETIETLARGGRHE